jgi:hypothetical protein
LIPAGDGEGLPYRPPPGGIIRRRSSNSPLVPPKEEIEKLPRSARLAFARRCAERARFPLPDDVALDVIEVVTRTARQLLEQATLGTPLTAQLRCLRRDLVRLQRLAREQKWTDDSPVPPDAFGPLWPPGLAPRRPQEEADTPSPAVE